MRVLDRLLRSREPSVVWRVRTRVLGEDRSSPRVRRLEAAVRSSVRVRRLLAHRGRNFRDGAYRNLYHYWQGLHWALASMADLGYPREDPAVQPLLDQLLDFWTRPGYLALSTPQASGGSGGAWAVPVVDGRARRCASQQGNALFAATRLGGPNPRADLLVRLLRRWQWPDGGWNCDRRPGADTSSFMETLVPMRGLTAYAEAAGSSTARRSARRAADVFLDRRLFRRRRDGRVIRPDFLRLHYPLYWHYDVLGGLKALAELGRIADPRCAEALDWVEQRELPRGGWPADRAFYRTRTDFHSGGEFVDWGPCHPARANPWVTTDALFVLREAGRFTP
jgi:hypothetical protein